MCHIVSVMGKGNPEYAKSLRWKKKLGGTHQKIRDLGFKILINIETLGGIIRPCKICLPFVKDDY